MESLKKVHTREELEEARKRVFALRDKLLAESVEFREETRLRGEAMRKEAEARRRDIERQAKSHGQFMDRTLADIQHRFLEAERLKRKR